MPFQQRYSNIITGGILFVGNTLGLSKLSNAYSPGLLGSIGAFITPDTTQRVGTFPYGTTLDYTKNGSSAVLNMPSGEQSVVCRAYLGRLVQIFAFGSFCPYKRPDRAAYLERGLCRVARFADKTGLFDPGRNDHGGVLCPKRKRDVARQGGDERNVYDWESAFTDRTSGSEHGGNEPCRLDACRGV